MNNKGIIVGVFWIELFAILARALFILLHRLSMFKHNIVLSLLHSDDKAVLQGCEQLKLFWSIIRRTASTLPLYDFVALKLKYEKLCYRNFKYVWKWLKII